MNRTGAARYATVGILSICGLAAIAASTACAAEPITIESLLTEMVDRDSVARFPLAEFRLRQQSSYDRLSKSPDDPQGWFANKDNTKNFVRVEEDRGRKEWVLMEDEGPGAIVRIRMPFRSRSTANTNSQIRIYLDGSTEPVLEGNMLGLFNGTGLIPFPFAHKSLRSAVSFFPIPYAKSCKVTVTEQPFFFQFTYREYAAGTPVKTFTIEDFQVATALVQRTGDTLLDPQNTEAGERVALATSLAAKTEKAIDLPAGNTAIRGMSLKLGSYEDPAITRSVVLKMVFDGKETVWCPVGDFFGTGIGLHPFQGWYRTVAEDGTMSCRWVMPYREAGEISIVNLSDEPVDVQLDAVVGDWAWDERSMYFHAAWRGQYPVPTRPYSDWNYVTLTGRGVYVGDTLTIMNPVERWWGEGDEKIYVDGEDFPSIFGTGTEDYYAYSWGGISTDFYEHPFHAQVRSHIYDRLNRKTTTEANTFGYSTETRSRSLDTMPFGSSLQLDMEVWSWTDCDMGYGVGTYWYGDADTTSNREPDPEEAVVLPPLPESGASTTVPAKASATRFEGAIECETMTIVAKSDAIAAQPQALHRFRKHRWSDSRHLFVREGTIGDFVELSFPAGGPSPVKLILHATRSHDYGILRFSVNGQAAGADIDLYANDPIPSGPITLGGFEPVENAFTLRVEINGKNPKSAGTYFGLDCMVVGPNVKSQQTEAAPKMGRRS